MDRTRRTIYSISLPVRESSMIIINDGRQPEPHIIRISKAKQSNPTTNTWSVRETCVTRDKTRLDGGREETKAAPLQFNADWLWCGLRESHLLAGRSLSIPLGGRVIREPHADSRAISARGKRRQSEFVASVRNHRNHRGWHSSWLAKKMSSTCLKIHLKTQWLLLPVN